MVFELAWCNKSYWVGPLQQVEIKLAIFRDDITRFCTVVRLLQPPNSSSVIVSNSENTSRNTNTTKILATTYFSPLVVVSNYINARFDEKLFLHQGRRFSSKIYILMLYRLLKQIKGKTRYHFNYCWNISRYFVVFSPSNNQEMVKSPSIAIICWPRSFLKFLENSWRARSCIYRLIECNWALKLIAALTILSIYQFSPFVWICSVFVI